MFRASPLTLAGILFAVGAVMAVAVALSGQAEGHGGHAQKKLFEERWYQQVPGGDYNEWMTLSTSGPFAVSCIDVDGCGSRWENPIHASMADWNGQATTVKLDPQSGFNEYYDFNFEVTDFILGNPFILGLAAPFDETYTVCFGQDDCVVYYGWVLLGDAAHIFEYGTDIALQSTVSHEIGHLYALRHESVNADESLLYDCGLDDTGTIPNSIMSYNCGDPVELGGQGIYTVQPWDVCGVNHAYHDPTIGYAGCTNFEPPTPSPSPEPTPSPTPFTGALTWGDVTCGSGANPVDALALLRYDAGQPVQVPSGCPHLGDNLTVQPAGGATRIWGDIDCSGNADPVDGLKLLRYDAGLSVAKSDATCPDIGDQVFD